MSHRLLDIDLDDLSLLGCFRGLIRFMGLEGFEGLNPSPFTFKPLLDNSIQWQGDSYLASLGNFLSSDLISSTVFVSFSYLATGGCNGKTIETPLSGFFFQRKQDKVILFSHKPLTKTQMVDRKTAIKIPGTLASSKPITNNHNRCIRLSMGV